MKKYDGRGHASSGGVLLKKKFGQHFLRDQDIVDHMISRVQLDSRSSVFEIGCGDGFLTRGILARSIARLWCFEIDHEWAEKVRRELVDPRLTIFEEDILSVDFHRLEPDRPWVVLANLPYQITFPILYQFERNCHLLQEGVVMVQEEVAQKVVSTGGRGFGFTALFFQHAFEWELLDKVPPTSFLPPPKVFSRLLYFKPRAEREAIPQEERFWKFVKHCFNQPRRTLKNNLVSAGFTIDRIAPELLQLRAQQMDKKQLLTIWSLVKDSRGF